MYFQLFVDIEGYLWMVTWLGGRIWTEINVLTSNLIWLDGRFWIETLCRPKILLYVVSLFNATFICQVAQAGMTPIIFVIVHAQNTKIWEKNDIF